MPPTGSAPMFAVPMREIVALEHPMIIQNIDNGLKTLGSGVPLQQVSTPSLVLEAQRFSLGPSRLESGFANSYMIMNKANLSRSYSMPTVMRAVFLSIFEQ
jgi:hypothetical protein